MAVHKQAYLEINNELTGRQVTLVAVSKTKPVEAILELYELGHRDFGENYVQEIVDKAEKLPKDIRWHFIGHLQTNKVKYIADFIHLIHGVDSFRLLKEVNKQATKYNRKIECLLQVHIAKEETKFGLDENELQEILNEEEIKSLKNISISGLMGMASFTENLQVVRDEFARLHNIFTKIQKQDPAFRILSMGMSSDYKVAIEEGSNMVRIGSLLFGERTYK